MLPRFSYLRASSVEQASRSLVPGARLHAGGTDLLGCLHDGVFAADTLVSLRDVPELAGIRKATDGGLRIGAMTSIADIAASPLVRERWRGLAEAAATVASPQLRNQGTIGGNLCQKPRCWYYRGEFDCLRKGGDTCFAVSGENQYHCILGGDACVIVHPSDTAPALIALDAVVRAVGRDGARLLPVAELHVPPALDPQRETFLAPDEVLTEVLLPPAPAALVSSYRKVRARGSWDFALAGVALALVREKGVVRHARVVLAGAAPVPWRSREAEGELLGKKLEPATIGRAAAAAMAAAVPLEKNEYKPALFRGLITAQLEALA